MFSRTKLNVFSSIVFIIVDLFYNDPSINSNLDGDPLSMNTNLDGDLLLMNTNLDGNPLSMNTNLAGDPSSNNTNVDGDSLSMNTNLNTHISLFVIKFSVINFGFNEENVIERKDQM